MRALLPALVALAITRSIPAAAHDWDYALQALALSFPTEAALQGELGYAIPLWGRPSTESIDFGYLRPGIVLQTAGLVNRADLFLEFVPAPLFILRGGHTGSIRSTDYTGIDCNSFGCRGTLAGNYISGKLQFALGPAFGFAQVQASSLSASVRDRPFFDEQSMLPGQAGGDTQVSRELLAGSKLGGRYSAGVDFIHTRFLNQPSHSTLGLVFLGQTFDCYRFVLGAGNYSSTELGSGFTGYLSLQWTGRPPLGLSY